jgi:hypothetical protein
MRKLQTRARFLEGAGAFVYGNVEPLRGEGKRGRQTGNSGPRDDDVPFHGDRI